MSNKPQQHERSPRTIQTVYYHRGATVKINMAAHANSAVLRCVDHMQLNHYGANVCEVFDNKTGELHAVITRNIKGNIDIVFKRVVEEGM